METFGRIDSCRQLLKIYGKEQCPAYIAILRERLRYHIEYNRYVPVRSNDIMIKRYLTEWVL